MLLRAPGNVLRCAMVRLNGKNAGTMSFPKTITFVRVIFSVAHRAQAQGQAGRRLSALFSECLTERARRTDARAKNPNIQKPTSAFLRPGINGGVPIADPQMECKLNSTLFQGSGAAGKNKKTRLWRRRNTEVFLVHRSAGHF